MILKNIVGAGVIAGAIGFSAIGLAGVANGGRGFGGPGIGGRGFGGPGVGGRGFGGPGGWGGPPCLIGLCI